MFSQNNKIKKIGWGFGVCNMNCRHCYNASTQNMIRHSFNKLKTIADKICSQGITDINFGTGEFLINSNALRVAQYIKDKYPKVALGLTSNGYSVINMELNLLKKLFHDIDISVDFPDKDKHNLFRKYKSSLRVNWFRPTGRGNKKLCISAVRFWEIIYLLSCNAIFEGLSDPILEAVILGHSSNGHCSCGWTSARIQQDLSVTPCVFLKGRKWDSGNILDNSLQEIYKHDNFRLVRGRKIRKCQGCKYWQACHGGCASRAYLQEGSLEEVDAYCPFQNREIEKLIPKIKKNIKIKNSNKVHHGYLCTLIVK